MKCGSVLELIGNGGCSSEHIRSIQLLKERKMSGSSLFGKKTRNLRPEEIAQLSAQRNRASAWGDIRVVEDFSPDNIFDTLFRGTCILGSFRGKEMDLDAGIPFPSGIYHSVICNSEIGNDCLIFRAGIIANSLIQDNAIVYECGSLVCTGQSNFGNGNLISIGIETGGREIAAYAELTIEVASAVALSRYNSEQLNMYDEFVKQYSEQCHIPFCVIEPGAVIRNTSRVENCFLGQSGHINGATLVENSTILSNPDEPVEISHGAFVRNAIVQWGCEVTSMGILDSSVMTEHSHLERHGKITSSIIGPNTGIAEGEVTACLLGPFVGFHHQALLIAAVWPEGKGNIAYGANVGSNHTSKAPDQEIWCGEGTFFGLGVNIKFPSDFSRAPYSLFATAVCTLPQRLEFPFSLINTPSFHPAGLPPLRNEIFPGWVLYNNIYTVMRNEGKYIKRNKARRCTFTFNVFRSEIIDLMISARTYLQNVIEKREIYTEKEIRGLGKNFLTEDSRRKGIDSYTFYIEYYCLLALKEKLSELLPTDPSIVHTLRETPAPGSPWEHARCLLLSEGYGARPIKECLERLVQIEEKIASDTERSKARDDERGIRIIDDYKHTHEHASHDSFVKEMWRKYSELKHEIEMIQKTL